MKKKITIIISVVIVLLFLVAMTRALYTSNYIQDYYLNSKGFYFDTDYDKKVNVYNFWDGSQIEMTVLNSKQDKHTEDDIKYEVECKVNNATCSINGSNNKYPSTLKGKEESKETLYFDINSDDKDIEVNITIKSTSPYKKTITKQVLLHKDNSLIGSFNYELINYDNYSLLNISNYYNEDKCFNVKIKEKDLLVSVNDVNVIASDSEGYVTEFTKEIKKNDTVSIKLYNQGTNTYDSKAFEISECLLES